MLRQEENFSKANVQQKLGYIKKLIEEDTAENASLSEQRLYSIQYNLISEFFDTEQELIQYIQLNRSKLEKSDCVSISILDFIGDFAGKKDVIRFASSTSGCLFCTALDEENHAIYSKERSKKEQRPIWEHQYGGLREIYMAFRRKGIIFQNDIYAKSDSLYERIMLDLMRDVEVRGKSR